MKKIMASLILMMMLVTMSTMFMTVAMADGDDGSSEDFEIGFTVDEETGRMDLSRGGSAQQDGQSAWQKLIERYRNFIVGVSGIGAVTMLGVFIVNFMKLGTNATSNKRSDIITGLIWSGVAAAGLGAVAFIVGFFYNAIV